MRKILLGLVAAPLTLLFAGNVFAAPMAPSMQFNQGVVTWQQQPGASCYRIYFKEAKAKSWQHAVQCKNLPSTSKSYTIKHLKVGVAYTYVVAAVTNNIDKFLGEHPLTNTSSM